MPLVHHVFQKGKATCFAYGQTGSGKTHTMLGRPDGLPPGIYLLAVRDIFKMLQAPQYQNLRVTVSFYEIYGGKLFDLLNGRKLLHAREDASHAVNIVGLKETVVDSPDSLLALLAYGNSVRSTGVTGANADSSRSHAVLQIQLKEDRSGKLHGPSAGSLSPPSLSLSLLVSRHSPLSSCTHVFSRMGMQRRQDLVH